MKLTIELRPGEEAVIRATSDRGYRSINLTEERLKEIVEMEDLLELNQTLLQLVREIDRRGWLFDIENMSSNSERETWGDWKAVSQADVGCNIYQAQPDPSVRKEPRMLYNGYGQASLEETLLRVAGFLTEIQEEDDKRKATALVAQERGTA